jgi:hypothetical protein
MKDFPGLFNIQVSSEHRSYLLFAKHKKNIPVTVWYTEPVTPPANVALRLYEGMEVMFLMTLLYSQIKTATTTAGMFCNT